ncbi:MAG: hypothetical protein JSS74_14320 [Actinobacteria bacterium]|nr:hypothetical protein [Actinomycetota bacterium]
MTGEAPSVEIAQDDQNPASNTVEVDDTWNSGSASDEIPLPAIAPQHGYLGFTIRELIIIGAWLVAFAFSFVPAGGSVLDGAATVWTQNGEWLLAIGVPTAAVFLVVLRRLSPEGIRRVGSLGIDQFASVAFSVALVTWVVQLWAQLELVDATRRSPLATWPLWVLILLFAVLVGVTVFAPLFPALREDFEGRRETLAHRNADPVRPVLSRTRPVRARGSVSDPLNEDDVDPGLQHGDEVGAAEHVSEGSAGATVPGAAGYVPEQHRESFLVAEEDVDATRPNAQSQRADVPAAEAATEAILDPVAPAGRRAHKTGVAQPEPVTTEQSEPGATEPAAAEQSAPEPEDPPHSDTMTQVLGSLLEPATEDTATNIVDVVAENRDDEDRDADKARRSFPAAPPAQGQPFWALAPQTRPVHDARGEEIFTIGPDAWILVLEDRGGAYVVRHDDGRVGYLHDTDDMTRG